MQLAVSCEECYVMSFKKSPSS